VGARSANSVPPILLAGCDHPNPVTHHQRIHKEGLPWEEGKREEGELEEGTPEMGNV